MARAQERAAGFGRVRVAAALVAALVWLSLAGGGTPLPARAAPEVPQTVVETQGDPVVLAAGDIADCGPGAVATAALLDGTTGTVLTTGDNAYPNGTAADFRDCYEPTWGRHLGRTRPSPGNHDYHTGGAAPYFGY